MRRCRRYVKFQIENCKLHNEFSWPDRLDTAILYFCNLLSALRRAPLAGMFHGGKSSGGRAASQGGNGPGVFPIGLPSVIASLLCRFAA